MRALQLVLKKKWFDMIASGEKREEYREIKPHWMKHFMRCYSKEKCLAGECGEIIQGKTWPCYAGIHNKYCNKFCGWDNVTFYHGYATDRPSMTFSVDRIDVGTGNPEWGAEPGKKYFVIKLKERLDQ